MRRSTTKRIRSLVDGAERSAQPTEPQWSRAPQVRADQLHSRTRRPGASAEPSTQSRQAQTLHRFCIVPPSSLLSGVRHHPSDD